MEVEQCIRRDGQEIRNFLHSINTSVDKGWLDDMNGIAGAQQNAKRETKAKQRRQRYMDHNLRRFRPKNLELKAQKCLLEHPNAT